MFFWKSAADPFLLFPFPLPRDAWKTKQKQLNNYVTSRRLNIWNILQNYQNEKLVVSQILDLLPFSGALNYIYAINTYCQFFDLINISTFFVKRSVIDFPFS